MSNMQAFGYFLDWCNGNVGYYGITQERFEKKGREILNMPEGSFAHCVKLDDILAVIGW